MHPHQRCPECGRVCDAEDTQLTKLQHEMEKLLPALGCRTLKIELCGVCNHCHSTETQEVTICKIRKYTVAPAANCR
jgi:Fe2+ or Zn2+ uptake regulation protein